MNKMLKITFIATILCICLHKDAFASSEPMAGISITLDGMDYLNLEGTFPVYNWTNNRVNFRKEASLDGEIIVTLDKRTKVELVCDLGKWSKVEYKNKTGYIYSEFLNSKELFTSDKNRWKIELTDDEIDLLAKIVWLESRGESDEGSAYVAIVIINRILHIEFSDTLYEVLSDKGEFSTWKLLDTAKPTEREYEIVEEVLRGEYDGILNEDYVYFSTSPRNNRGTIKIGHHYFCKE